MPLKLIHGPPNSGRAGLLRGAFVAALERDPVLVVPTVDDVFAFERELCAAGAALGGSAMTFGALFHTVATAGGVPPGAELSPAQRLRTVAVAVEARRGRLGPLRRSASRPGFARAFVRLLDELQAAGLDPEAVEASAGTLEGSAYLGDIAGLFSAYAEVRERTGRVDSHGIAREAIELLRRDGSFWGDRPVFLYGLDDLTPNQFELVAALAGLTEVTVALPFEEGNAALAARSRLLGELRERIGAAEEVTTAAQPGNTDSELLFHLARGFGAPGATPRAPDDDLLLLRSAGVRGEAEAIATEVSKLVAGGADPAAIAIALRDPARRGGAVAAALEANGVATALEAELPVAGTAVGGALVALLEAEFGTRRAADLLRYLRGPSGFSQGRVDWLERALRRGRIEDAEKALALWQGEEGEPPRDLLRLREAATRSPAALAAEIGKLAATMAARPLRGAGDGPALGQGDGLELRAAGAIAGALAELAELGPLAPGPAELAATIAALEFRVWSGPVEGRVRIASPYRLRAGRFDHVFVGSLQDGEFPRRDRGGDPFLSEAQRGSLGLEPRRDSEAEERYLFGVCLALPRRRLFLSYRDSDESGGAESRSPLLDEVRALLAPAPDGSSPDPVEEAITRSRGLARSRPAAGRGALGGRAGAGAGGARAGRRRRGAAGRGRRRGGSRRADRRQDRLRPRRRGRLARARPADQPGGDRVAGRGRRLRRHHAGGLRPLLLPLVRQPRARPAAARPGPRPAGPGRPHARVARPPIQGAPRRRPAPPPRLPPGLDRARARARRRGRGREGTRLPPGRAGDGAAGRAPAGALPHRRGGAGDGRLRALAAGGRLRRARGGRAADPGAGRLGAARGDRPGRPRARRPRPGHRLQAVGLGDAAGEVRGAGEAAAPSLPAGGGASTGERSRSAPSTTRCAGPRCGARAGW